MRLVAILTLLALCLLLSGCGQSEQKTKSEPQPASESTPSDSLTIELTGADSVSVFELLTQNHDVDYQSSAMGVFVKAIDSVYANDQYFWVYSVNDTMAQVAADKYLTGTADQVVWHFRQIGR